MGMRSRYRLGDLDLEVGACFVFCSHKHPQLWAILPEGRQWTANKKTDPVPVCHGKLSTELSKSKIFTTPELFSISKDPLANHKWN